LTGAVNFMRVAARGAVAPDDVAGEEPDRIGVQRKLHQSNISKEQQ
jgi:hypothetical protein